MQMKQGLPAREQEMQQDADGQDGKKGDEKKAGRPPGLPKPETKRKQPAEPAAQRPGILQQADSAFVGVRGDESADQRRTSSIHLVHPINAFQSQRREEGRRAQAERKPVPSAVGEDYFDNQATFAGDRRATATFCKDSRAGRPNGGFPPPERPHEQREAESSMFRLHGVEMAESSHSNVTANEKEAANVQVKSYNSSFSQYAWKPAALTDNSKSNNSGCGPGETAEAFVRPSHQPGALQPPRGAVRKSKRRPESRKKKYRDLLDECAPTRYALYYADDVVQHGLRTKAEVQHRLLADKMDGKFEKDLREKEGIFFAINVRPTSPPKRCNQDSVLKPFSRDPNKRKSDNSISEQSSAVKNFGQNFQVHENEVYRCQSTFGRAHGEQARVQVSPTFKQSLSKDKDGKQQFFTGESPTSSPKRYSSPEMIQKGQQPSSSNQADMAEPKLRSRRSSDHLELSAQDSLVDLEEMLLSNQNSSRQLPQEYQQKGRPTTQPQDQEAHVAADVLEITVKKRNEDPRVQEVKATFVSAQTKQPGQDRVRNSEQPARPDGRSRTGSSHSDGGDQMRRLSSYLNTNYDSPNIMDIMKERRLHEIEEIDRRVSIKYNHRGLQACTGSEDGHGPSSGGEEGGAGQAGENLIGDGVMSAEEQQALWYARAPGMAEVGPTNSRNVAPGEVSSRNGAEDDMEVLSFPMVNVEREVSFKKVDMYNNKFNQTQSAPNANESRNRAAKSDREAAHPRFGGYGHTPVQRSDTKRLASSKMFAEEMRRVPPEPKSSLLREDRKIGRCSTVLIDQGVGFKQQERSTLRNLKNSQDLSENCSNVSESSTSSQQSSNKIFHANMQLYKMKSMVTNKVSVGGRKLDRQAELRNRNEALSLCKDSGQDSQQQKDTNNEPYKINKDLGRLSSKRQYSQNLANFNYVNALTNKPQPPHPKQRTSALNIKKNETVEPYLNSLALDSNGHSSNMQKASTSVRKDSVNKSKKTGDRSLVAQTSSNRDPKVPHSKQSARLGNTQLRRQRRKEMRQFRKFLKDWPVFPSKEEREEEEIVQKQVSGLNQLKALCERLKGQPITTNCYNGGDNAGEDNDLSNNDATTNGAADQYQVHNLHPEGAQLGQYLHSHGSKDPSVSVSTPNNVHHRSSNNQAKEHQTANKAINNELGRYLRQIDADHEPVGRGTILSTSKSEYHIQEDGGQGRQQTMNDTGKRKKKTMGQGSSFSKQEDFLDYHTANEQERGLTNMKQEPERASQQRQEQRQRQDTVSISGYNEDHKFSLNVRDVDFSQISNNKSNDVSNKSIGSIDEGTIGLSVDARKKGASQNFNDEPFSKGRLVSPLGAETTSSRGAGQLQQHASQNDLSRSRDGFSERSDFMKRGQQALDRRIFDHRDTFGQPFPQKTSTTKLNQNFLHLRRPSKLLHDYQGAERIDEGAKALQLSSNKFKDASDAPEAPKNGHESFASIQDRDKLHSVPEASQSTMSRPNQNANNLNIFDPARQGDESSLSVPFSPYLPSADINSSEQQSFSPSVLEQSQLGWKDGPQKPLIREMQSPIHLISEGATQDQPLSLGCPQRSSNLDRGASQESLGQAPQRQGHGSGRPRPGHGQSHKPFGLKIYELDMEVEQSRRANDEVAPSNATDQNAASSPGRHHEGSEEMMDINQSPQFQTGYDPKDRALAGSSFQRKHPQTSPMDSGTSPLVDDSVLTQQLANSKPIMKKNAQSHHISPSNKRRLNVNINEATQAPAFIYSNINQTATHKRFQTSKNILKGPQVEAGGFSTNLDLLLSRNSRNERLSSNQMPGLSSMISGSESEFSFKKNQAFFSKERSGKFEVSLNKMEGYSFKKIDSPSHFANDAYASQHSISKVSKTSLNQVSSLGKEYANSSNFMNDSKSSNQSREKKLQNQTQNANKSGISFNLMKCLKDIDRDIDQKFGSQQRTVAWEQREQARDRVLQENDHEGSAKRVGDQTDGKRPVQTRKASRSQMGRAEAERVQQRQADGERRLEEKQPTAKVDNGAALPPRSNGVDPSLPSENHPAERSRHQKRPATTNSAMKGAAIMKYAQEEVQDLFQQESIIEGQHKSAVLSDSGRETRILRPKNSKSQLSHLSEAGIPGAEQRSQSQTKVSRPLNESNEKIRRMQMQMSRTSKSNEALLREQRVATEKQYGAQESSPIRIEGPLYPHDNSRSRPQRISSQEKNQQSPQIDGFRPDELGEKRKAGKQRRHGQQEEQERQNSGLLEQPMNPKLHFANRQSVIPNLNKQFSDVPDKVARKKSEQNRPQGAEAPQMQSQHFQQWRGIDQTSISKGSYLDQRASHLSKRPAQAHLSVAKTLASDQSQRIPESLPASRKMMIEDDLNELKSLLDRHHKRTTTKQQQKKTKKKDGLAGPGAHGKKRALDAITEDDLGAQSIYDDTYSHFGVTSYGTYKMRKDGLEALGHSKAPRGGAPRPKYKLFQQSNNVRLSPRQAEPDRGLAQGRLISIVNVDHAIGGAPRGGPTIPNVPYTDNFYQIEDDGTDKYSIYNGAESHLGDEFGEDPARGHRTHAQMPRHMAGWERNTRNPSPDLISKSAADQRSVAQSKKTAPAKSVDQEALSRQLARPAKNKQPHCQILNLEQQPRSQYSSYSQSKRLGYSNYFQQKYVCAPRQRSNSRNAPRPTSTTGRAAGANSKASVRPVLLSLQVSATKAPGEQMLAYDTFSQERGALPATLSIQPSLQKMGEGLGQPQQTSGQWQLPGAARLDMMAFTRTASIADIGKAGENTFTRWEAQSPAVHLNNFAQFSETRYPLERTMQSRPMAMYNLTPFQQTAGRAAGEEEAILFAGSFAPSVRRSGTFGHSDATSKVQSGHGPSRALQSGRWNQNAEGSHAAGPFAGPCSGTVNVSSGPPGEGRSSGGARGQLRENILQRMKEPRMPVYYEDPDGARFSIVSETVQAQPYRPEGAMRSAKRTYQENINGSSARRAADPDNPFSPMESDESQSLLPPGDSARASGKTCNFPKQSMVGADTHAWRDPASRPSQPERARRDTQRPGEEEPPGRVVPFVLDLGGHMDSEPTHASYLQQRQQLMRRP